jgi:anaerobic selenocysteine-containing dehydrogenase
VPNIDRTHYFLMLGMNPKISNGAMMSTGANPHKKLDAIRARGGKVVLFDPRRTETVEHCDEHFFIRPATDALFLIGIIKEVFAAGLATPGRLASHIKGWDAIEPALADFEIADIARVTGVPADDIGRIAREFATADTAVCYGRTGLSMQEFGGLCQWLMQVLNIVTGNLDEPGGMMFPVPAIDMIATGAARGSYDRYRSRVRNRPEFAGEMPLAVLAEEILTPGEGRIRGLLATCGNPVLSGPNGRHLEEALDDLEYMVSVDYYLNETTKHADIIIPPVGPFEKSHYDLFYHTYDTIDWTTYHEPLFEPEAPGYTDWEIMGEILRRYVVEREHNPVKAMFKSVVGRLTTRALTVERILDIGLRSGPYGAGLKFWRSGLSLKKLRANPHGVFLGEPEPHFPERIFTRDKMIDIAPDVIVADLPRLRQRWIEGPPPPSEFDLVVVSRLTKRTLGFMHQSRRLVRGKTVCVLQIHPDDADARGLADGDPATMTSAVGWIDVPVKIDDSMMPGVVCMPHIWGHNRSGTMLSVASQHAGVSLNDITDDGVQDELTGNAIVHGVPVRVEPSSARTSDPAMATPARIDGRREPQRLSDQPAGASP